MEDVLMDQLIKTMPGSAVLKWIR